MPSLEDCVDHSCQPRTRTTGTRSLTGPRRARRKLDDFDDFGTGSGGETTPGGSAFRGASRTEAWSLTERMSPDCAGGEPNRTTAGPRGNLRSVLLPGAASNGRVRRLPGEVTSQRRDTATHVPGTGLVSPNRLGGCHGHGSSTLLYWSDRGKHAVMELVEVLQTASGAIKPEIFASLTIA